MSSQFGIIHLSHVPVRAKNSDKSEMINQLLFAELFEILEISDSWTRIKTPADEFVGWIDNKQYIKVDKDYADNYLKQSHPILNSIIGNITSKPPTLITLGCLLPFWKKSFIDLGDGETKSLDNAEVILNPHQDWESLQSIALKYLNTPYLWGGRSIFGIDCSGFMQVIFRMIGVQIPRDAWQQALIGESIDGLAHSKRGDLAFFHKNERVTHVGLILDDNKIIHASGKVRIDELHTEGIYNSEIKEYSHNYHSIKRITELP